MALARFARVWLAVEGLNAHLSHQPAHALSSNVEVLAIQQIPQHTTARKRKIQMQCIDPTQQSQIFTRYSFR